MGVLPKHHRGYDFFLRQWLGVKEGLHGGLAKAPLALMSPFDIVAADPVVEVGLQFCDRTVDLFSEGDAVELVERRLVESLGNSVRLRVLVLVRE